VTAFAHLTVSEEPRYQGAIFSVRTDQVTMSSGRTVSRDVVAAKGAVGVVAIDDVDRVVLIKQYRHAVGGYLWELPAGLRDVDGEDLVTGAARELAEEADLTAGRYDLLIDLHTSPGFTDEREFLFLARPVHRTIQHHTYDDAEMILECGEFSPAQITAMIADDTIRDANTLSMWARLVAKGIIQLPHR